ncbi:MAG TPA: O-antigen ligase domain-containing protein, partial [Acidobacteria bacterium]|nr:O-antigen ligase domain-containing protein [Acidobacteriota bacterium]
MKASRPKKTSFDHRAFRWMAAGLVGLFLVRSWKTADPEVLPRFVVVAAVLGVVLLLAVVRTLRGKLVLDRSILRNAVALAWLAGVVVSAASILVAVNRSEALFASLRAGVFFVLFVVLVRLMLGNEGRVRAAAAALGPLALVLGLVGAYQLVRAVDTVGWIWRTTYLVKGLAGHRNFLVQTLLVTLPFAAWSMVVHRGVKRLLMTGTVLLSGGLIAVLMVRSVWVAAIVATAASALLGAAAARKRGASSARGIRRHVAIAVGLLVTGAVIALVLLGPSGRTALAQRLRTLAQPASGSAGGRLFLWRTTLHMVRDHPLLGVGGGNWRIVFPAYAGNRHMMRDIWKTPRRPHNDYLWILAENGPAGLLAYLAMIATLLWWTARTTLAARDVPSMLLGVALFFAETAYTVFSAFSFPRERVGLSVVVTLVFAMATALHLGERPQAGKLGRRPLLALTAAALAVTVAA